MNLIKEILAREEFKEQPPVLIDIGASKEIHEDWKKIAKHSICIAFDADKRDIDYIEGEKSNFKNLYIINKIVIDEYKDISDFYLTKSPYCSSKLKPDIDKLKEWSFSDLFEIKEKIKLETIHLLTLLKDLKIKYIDWFKSDSQGTDLRLFKSLGKDYINKILIADFEPGIIDAYQNEDKLYSIMEYMNKNDFWLEDIIVKGPERINLDILRNEFNDNDFNFLKYRNSVLKKSPGWAEISYFNNFNNKNVLLNKREYLLGIIFAVIKEQYGYAMELAIKGFELFSDNFFLHTKRNIITKLKTKITLAKRIKFKLKKIFS